MRPDVGYKTLAHRHNMKDFPPFIYLSAGKVSAFRDFIFALTGDFTENFVAVFFILGYTDCKTKKELF
jgi:hypothetical protein